ncbi:hypothetical protein BU25DRAFT_410867 [Macroventuria anomochaeta]|uniref:Uncharacterized protein n=1 Tax=Macroventuria anomochaeta TaxID=301207 RepID=A0ACB6RYZ2_9PLEO|nr:uncharacterized protein BU25DRAFT_410867 [Macroventuria anomochaeta]KAF2627245.1 hypothetical protein BU25DRAFT_410867 [Macroventuria anomochaeta]
MASSPAHSTLWVPFCLRHRVLISFALLFAGLAVVLGIMYRMFNSDHGLAAPNTAIRYLWTYVPSSVFILVAGCWTLVESNLKLLAPWRAMARGPCRASKSILLDYITEIRITSLYSSIRNCDWDVSLGVLGTLCLNVIIVFSTGLFRVEPMSITRSNYRVPLTTSFNASGVIAQSGNGFATAYAISQYALDLPYGTAKTFAYQSVNTTEVPSGATLSFEVDAFYPETTCEAGVANWTFGVVYDQTTGVSGSAGAKMWATTSSCELEYTRSFTNDTENLTYLLDLGLANCTGARNPLRYEPRFAVFAGSMLVADLNMSPAERNFTNSTLELIEPEIPSYFSPRPSRMSQSSAASVFCSITPRLSKALLTVSQGQIASKLLSDDTARPPTNGTHERQLQTAIIQALYIDSMYMTGKNTDHPYTGPDMSVYKYGSLFTAFFQLLNDTNPQASIETLVDPVFLTNAVSQTLEFISSQMAANYLFAMDNSETVGLLQSNQERLTMPRLAFGIVVGLLATMVLVSLALCVQSKAVVPKDPTTIAGLATIISESSNFVEELAPVAHSAKATIQKCKHIGNFETSTTDVNGRRKFAIRANQADHTHMCCQNQEKPCEINIDWWKPWSTSTTCQITVVALPLTLIGVLEYLYRRSVRLDGVLEVPKNQYVQYAWVYIPVAGIFALKSIFELISSTNRIVQPYATMHRSPSAAQKSIHLDLVHRITLSALLQSFRWRLFGTAAAILATFLGAGLPIATSGLFVARTPTARTQVDFRQASRFDPDLALASRNTNEDYLPTPAFVLFNNLSYPQWTYGKYALPRVERQSDNQPTLSPGSGNASMRAELPAVFGVANCSVVPLEHITFSTGPPATFTQAPGSLTVDVRPVGGCKPMSYREDIFTEDFYVANWYSAWDVFRMNYTDDVPKTDLSQNKNASSYHSEYIIPIHCPLSAILLVKGKFLVSADNTSSVEIEDYKFLHCTPHVDQEVVEVNFTLPDFNIPASTAPAPKIGTRTFFSAAELLNTGFWANYLPVQRTLVLDPLIPNMQVDPFFRAIFGGRGGIRASEVVKDIPEMTEKLLERVDEVYGIIIAQIYGTKRRFDASAETSPSVHPATIVSSGKSRIQQDKISTRILQGLLGAMVLCAIVSMIFTKGKKILPQNPCSIAAVAAYLAKSSLLSKENIPDGSEFMNAKALRKHEILQGGFYSFGWWGKGKARRYGIDIGKAEGRD